MSCEYTLGSASLYKPEQEWHLHPSSQEGLLLIEKSTKVYHDFVKKFRSVLNLNQVESISETYEAAEQEGVFALAAKVRTTFFGKDMHFYGVTYLWDRCMESCVYCPAALENRQKTKYKPLALSVDEAVKDVQYIMKDGHRHICVLTGEDPLRYPPTVLAEYIRAFDQLGLKEIILNVEPPANWRDFNLWRQAASKTALQFRVFQETYNRKKYAEIHPVTKYGRKHDFDYRYHSQKRALDCGFDSVGLGVLFGNHHLPLEEVDALQHHAIELQQTTGKWPARICLPSAKYLENIAVNIPYSLSGAEAGYKQFSKIIYALMRLALPMINLVSSERDEPELLAILDDYATCTTLNVHPGVGDNIRFHEKTLLQQIHFEQAPSFSRDPNTLLSDLTSRGFKPWLSQCEEDLCVA